MNESFLKVKYEGVIVYFLIFMMECRYIRDFLLVWFNLKFLIDIGDVCMWCKIDVEINLYVYFFVFLK